MTIKNIIDELPKHPTKKWGKRNLSIISEVIVHQAAARGATAFNVNTYHITPSSDKNHDGVIESWERNHLSDTGAPHICYHYVIEKDGTIEQCNNVTDITWHAKGHNIMAIGIMLAGYFKGRGHEKADEPTKEQLDSLVWLLNKLHEDFPKISKNNYKGHCEVDPVNKIACPGYTTMKTLESWRHQ